MTIERMLSVVGMRHWDEVKRSWMGHMAGLATSVAPPDPGLERLSPLQESVLIDRRPTPDIDGVRSNTLAEAIYLYHKAAHAQLAVARLSTAGMTAWAMFNAYHSAFLNAKAVMALLGVVFPKVQGKDWIIDVFPVPDKRRNNRKFKMKADYSNFVAVSIPKLDQRYVWQALKRCCANTMGAWPNTPAVALIKDIDWERVTPPRNKFLYNPPYWPAIDDLSHDVVDLEWDDLIQAGLDPESTGFLLSLSLDMFEIARWLFEDFGSDSNLFAAQIRGVRWPSGDIAGEWGASVAYQRRAAA